MVYSTDELMLILNIMKHNVELKLDEELYSKLTSLESVMHSSMNQIITDAVSMYVKQKSGTVEQGLETTVQRIRQCVAKDPKFEHAISAFADAETRHEDPVEGTPVTFEISDVQTEIREIIDGG